MRIFSFFQPNNNEKINPIDLSNIKGGKRVLDALRSSPDEMLLMKARRRAMRRLGQNSGTFTMTFDNEVYTVEVSTESDMLHITGANGKDVCVEW
jgi:hypothetical protein